MDQPKVSIITLNWNGLEDTRECLESLKKVTYPNHEVIVVDNCSEGNDAQILEEEFGDYVRVIRNEKNYGFGEGCNTGIRYVLKRSHPKYILLINNDVVVQPDFLDELVKVGEDDPQVGIVGPKIYYYDYDGRNDVIWSAGGRVRWWALRINPQIGDTDDDTAKYQATTSVDWITGAVMMFKACLTEEVGLLDARYFIGHEDIDYCLKVRKRGYKVVYVPGARAWHKVGASAKKAHISYANPSNDYYLIKQNFPSYVYVYHLLLLPLILCRWALLFLVKHRNRHTLRRFLSDFAMFVFHRHRMGP